MAHAPVRFRAEIKNWRPMAKTDGPNARLHWRDRDKRKLVVAGYVKAALNEARWPQGWGLGAEGFVLRFTVFQAAGMPPDDDNIRGMLKDVRDCTLVEIGMAKQVIRRKGKNAGSGWMRASDGQADSLRFEYRWVRGSSDAVVIELERRGQ